MHMVTTAYKARLEQIREARKRDKGFTLIELLIVIVILGVLAGIVVFAVGGITDRGQTSACASDQKSLQVAVEAYVASPTGNGKYPLTDAAAAAALVPGFLHTYPTTMVYTATGGATPTGFTVGGKAGTACASTVAA
jgi:general secretion pathway protein G